MESGLQIIYLIKKMKKAHIFGNNITLNKKFNYISEVDEEDFIYLSKFDNVHFQNY